MSLAHPAAQRLSPSHACSPLMNLRRCILLLSHDSPSCSCIRHPPPPESPSSQGFPPTNVLQTFSTLEADTLVPHLFCHLAQLPPASALALLARCAGTSYLTLLPYAAALAGAMLDLLQIKSVRVPAALTPLSFHPST
ncbi:hypothetical protein EVG20_g10136 [Dentipellis fragilis]|uniref:Uncharacterized protein n=1 Tax=Dentipellis fragilis TaxID=205917 RepID=A0A4Y9XTL9_9AGAM|nr:hypothetical protein EVG20_g10136 [Dentipellis fragilis]